MVTLIGMTLSQNPNLVVVGALHVDEIATSARPLTLGESNVVTWQRSAGGVASNVARAAAMTTAPTQHPEHPVTLIANCGDGTTGLALQQALSQAGVQVKATHKNVNHTGRYTAVLQPNGEVLVGLADVAQAEDIEVSHVIPHLPTPHPVTLVLDGNLSKQCLTDLSALQTQSIIGLCVSPEKAPRFLDALANLNVLFCNLSEAKTLVIAAQKSIPDSTPMEPETALEPESLGETLCHTGCKHIVMSLGSNGVLVTSQKQQTHIEVVPVDAPSTLNGPGDALAGATVTQCATSELSHEDLVQAIKHYGLPAARCVITGEHKAPKL